MTVGISVNGGRIHTLVIINRGPPPGVEDVVGGDGLRVYQWRSLEDHREGELLHSRGDGALALAIAVLDALND